MASLKGLRVLELGSIGPGPFCAMMLADHGATVIRIDRVSAVSSRYKPGNIDLTTRGRWALGLDLKSPEGIEFFKKLISSFDILIEGFRPGVMEGLGLGPNELLKLNEGLIYGRMTGYGQTGNMRSLAGHDINYISLSGVLGAIGRENEPPSIPLNLIGDYGGGGMLLAFGILAALYERQSSGKGQVIDCAMVDGSALLATMIFGFWQKNLWQDSRGVNLLDSGAPFYNVYRTRDDKYISVGAIEPQFYKELLRLLDCEDNPLLISQMDRSMWPKQKEVFANIFSKKTRDEWEQLFNGSDACVTPVLSFEEATKSKYASDRQLFTLADGILQPNPCPRFSRTPGSIKEASELEDIDRLLKESNIRQDEIDSLQKQGVLSLPK